MALVRQPLSSRIIRSAGYDPEAQVLELEFQSGGIYQYDAVPPQTWEWFLRAPSKTDFVNNIIKPNYAFRNVTAQNQQPAGDDDLFAALLASLNRPKT